MVNKNSIIYFLLTPSVGNKLEYNGALEQNDKNKTLRAGNNNHDNQGQ